MQPANKTWYDLPYRDDILVVGVLTQPDLYEKTISNMVECRSRGAYLMGLTTFGQYNIEDSTDFAVYIPKSTHTLQHLLL